MKVLVIGSGGREHALAWKCAQSPRVREVIVAPGNAGTAREPKTRNVEIAADDIAGLLDFAQRERVDLTVVGPEVPLVKGIADAFHDAGLRIFGPTRAAARLEGSKAFAKDFLARHRIPTAEFRTFTAVEPALDWIRRRGAPIVVKADGLAAGKGVIVAQTPAEAEHAVRDMLAGNAFGDAGHRVVIEDFLAGEEASFMLMVSGGQVLEFASSQDHKRVGDGDTGPNTGGMGAYSPAPVVTPDVRLRIIEEIVQPTLRGLREDGIDYTGFLYAGLMIAPDGTPRVLEFNCRLGDPETQPLMMRLRSDLVALIEAALDGKLDAIEAHWDPRTALGVVLAAAGYPESARKGDVITGLPVETPDAKVFHAGTKLLADGRVVTNGGRVLCAVALGSTVTEAQRRAYAFLDGIHWNGMFCRRDIGWRAVAREGGA
ncbi:MAG TPA: phosphoribosylamine--glycine ligase [Gammaproteobacteria bacterium]|nr:phosphoribosylamine--glycine ligase [Gammaproteobacteria bacterium]